VRAWTCRPPCSSWWAGAMRPPPVSKRSSRLSSRWPATTPSGSGSSRGQVGDGGWAGRCGCVTWAGGRGCCKVVMG
jgi:hypothetical protein